MLVRIISSIVLFPVLFILVFIGGLPLKFGVMFVSLVGLYEFYKAIYKKIIPIHYLGFIVSIIYLLILDTIFFQITDLIFVMLLLMSMIFMVFFHKTVDIYDVSLTFFGVFYITLMFSTVYLIRDFSYGIYMVWIPFICAWASDTGAYFIGVTMGKHKLTPELSPKKTIEGSIGGVLTSALICGIYGFFTSQHIKSMDYIFKNTTQIIICFVLIGVIGAIFSQFGDLTASATKRKFNVKDYGKIIPGHGGILDRFDSVIFTSGICYIILKMIENYYKGI